MTAQTANEHINRLAGEASLYLRQHAHNPVDWYPWGEEALARARAEDKPILLSIGYSSCHWCHVMAHESFEDPETARLMNEHYINIKVDREERPDLDEIYMLAVQTLTGQGGWPMTVFLTPAGRPFYAGTYFPPEDRHGLPAFRRVLSYLAAQFRSRRDEIERLGAELAQSLQQMAAPRWAAGELSADDLAAARQQLLAVYDRENGGFGPAPKFPQPTTLQLLMRLAGEEPAARQAVLHTLDRMAAGGMYDVVGGGFHRYSVDEKWLVPHFEKMLYDNALLGAVYLDAYVWTQDGRYRDIVTQTCDYLLREMRLPAGGFAAAQDADTAEGEGRFFAWTPRSLAEALEPADAGWAQAYFGVTPAGNFEHGLSLLRPTMLLEELARQLGMGTAEAASRLDAMRRRLLEARGRRPAPARDDKMLTDWNGLAIATLARAGDVLSRPDYLQAAIETAERMLGLAAQRGRLQHIASGAETRGDAFLDDYAHLIVGLIELHQATLEECWLHEAETLCNAALAGFWDEADGGFFFTSDAGEALLLRAKKYIDLPVPSGNAVMVGNMLRLDALLGRPRYAELAARTLRSFGGAFRESAPALVQMGIALDLYVHGLEVITLVGPAGDARLEALRRAARSAYAPRRLVRSAEPGEEGRQLVAGQPAAYICRGRTCLPPVTEPAQLRT